MALSGTRSRQRCRCGQWAISAIILAHDGHSRNPAGAARRGRRQRAGPDRAGDVAPYLTDWRGRYHGRALAVVRPAARARSRPSCAPARTRASRSSPQGGNTGQCGGATPDASGDAVVLSLARMNRVRAVDRRQRDDDRRGRRARSSRCSRPPPTPGSCSRCRSRPKAAARSAATCRPTPAARRCCASAMRASSSLGIEVVLADGRDLGWPARPAQGQHRLRPEAALHRRRRHARHRHRRGAEALPGAAHARDRVRRARPTSRAAIALLRELRQALGDRLAGFELMSALVARAVAQASSRRCRIRCPGHPWYVLVQADDSARRFAACGARSNARSARRSSAASCAMRRSRSRASRRTRCGRCARTSPKRSGAKAPTSSTTSRCRSRRFPRFLDEARDARSSRRCPGVRFVTFGHLGDGNLHYNLAGAGGRRRRGVPRAYGDARTGSSTTSSPRTAAASAPSTASAS